jgi:hypothetical protein
MKYYERPCIACKENHYIYDKVKWLCKDCKKEKKEIREEKK